MVLYLSEEARQTLRDQRQLAAEGELPALLDSEVVEAALSQFVSGFIGPMGGDRHGELLRLLAEQRVHITHLQNLYLDRSGGNERKDLQTRKRWFQEVARAQMGGAPPPSRLDAAAACRTAIRATSGYHTKALAVDLGALLRQEMDFDDRENAMADRISAFVDLAFGVNTQDR